jgi:hypothetical protein
MGFRSSLISLTDRGGEVDGALFLSKQTRFEQSGFCLCLLERDTLPRLFGTMTMLLLSPALRFSAMLFAGSPSVDAAIAISSCVFPHWITSSLLHSESPWRSVRKAPSSNRLGSWPSPHPGTFKNGLLRQICGDLELAPLGRRRLVGRDRR